MAENTKERLVTAASDLLDAGGQDAVTLRAVAEAVGVSHNAPYRHFRDRSALLAAVAERDFNSLRQALLAGAGDQADTKLLLRAAAMVLIVYARRHPARYRLLFNDPDLPPGDGTVDAAALGAFQAFGGIVQRFQVGGSLQPIETTRLTGLIYATLHGAIDLELGGHAVDAKGLGSIEATMDLLIELLARAEPPVRVQEPPADARA